MPSIRSAGPRRRWPGDVGRGRRGHHSQGVNTLLAVQCLGLKTKQLQLAQLLRTGCFGWLAQNRHFTHLPISFKLVRSKDREMAWFRQGGVKFTVVTKMVRLP